MATSPSCLHLHTFNLHLRPSPSTFTFDFHLSTFTFALHLRSFTFAPSPSLLILHSSIIAFIYIIECFVPLILLPHASSSSRKLCGRFLVSPFPFLFSRFKLCVSVTHAQPSSSTTWEQQAMDGALQWSCCEWTPTQAQAQDFQTTKRTPARPV